jgi:hypothetical protein
VLGEPVWWASARLRDFWPHEARRVKREYPAFELRDRRPRPNLDPEDSERCGSFVRTWRGAMQPFPPTLNHEELLAIIFDLYNDGNIMIQAGELRHDSTRCTRSTHPLDADRLPRRPLTTMYEIELAYALPPARPIVRGLCPRLTQDEHREMPHPIGPLNALCVSYGPTDAWDLYRDGALRYLDWTAIYLAKHTLWLGGLRARRAR